MRYKRPQAETGDEHPRREERERRENTEAKLQQITAEANRKWRSIGVGKQKARSHSTVSHLSVHCPGFFFFWVAWGKIFVIGVVSGLRELDITHQEQIRALETTAKVLRREALDATTELETVRSKLRRIQDENVRLRLQTELHRFTPNRKSIIKVPLSF